MFMQKGRAYEIETSVELFCDKLLMSQSAGLRIQGASERDRPLKRFSLFSRKEYSGSRYFEYPLFGKKLHSFFMRQDFEDAFVQSLVTDRNVGTLAAVPAVVFLDGEYWYDTYLREKYSEDYLAEVFHVDREDVTIAEAVPEEIYRFVEEHDLSGEEAYREFGQLMDIGNYIDYLAINIYLCNMDGSESKNCRMWKTAGRSGEGFDDGKWRWLVYDMDCLTWNSIGYYGAERYGIDSFSHSKEYAGPAYNESPIYKALRGNEEFCRQFVLTFMDLANTNFSVETVAEQMTLWGADLSWNSSFFEKRFEYIVPLLAKEFDLEGTLEEIAISVNDEAAGYVTINTVAPALREGCWRGRYYTDYPVTVTAVPSEGYEFTGWRIGDKNALPEDSGIFADTEQIQIFLEQGGCSLEAVFESEPQICPDRG